MAVLNVNPTRMELTRLKKQLSTALRGHKLLKDKRDELMRQFLDEIRETKTLREEVEKELKGINADFVLASSVMSKEALDTALLAPKQEVYLETDTRNVMSVDIPVYSFKTRTSEESDIFSYGFASTSFELDDAVAGLSELLPKMLKLAEKEKAVKLMADEIEKTRRRVNALEHVMIPRYQETIHFISMKLEENERASRARLMKVKDMMIEENIEYKHTHPDAV
ncbi:MAG: V-type ATP synthase subunit D [Acutalibacteraceae bacterium]|nr:V-type ATP synthase subunit D [Clostridia bacterium]MEE1330163.1 V-type ATP synthase subunit D [Acutalibacteraceae bacterium]